MRRTHLLSTGLPGAVVAAGLVLAPQPAFAAEPTNNDFAAATVIAPEGGVVTADNEDSDSEPGEPSHGGEGSKWEHPFHTVWWSWTPDASGEATLSTCGSAFETRMSVYTGTAVDALTPVAGNEDDADSALCENPLFAVTTVPVTSGTTYYIAVDTSGPSSTTATRGARSSSGSPLPSVRSTRGTTTPTRESRPPKIRWSSPCRA